ncbi:MAG TPA: KamA family radical SAM protein [Myxococcota bacterium]|nr:KamA family radical SAM protein [Myxococcota bacterium]HRY92051.1 KamA family radical SAM protein [Myxococcota bacterium]
MPAGPAVTHPRRAAAALCEPGRLPLSARARAEVARVAERYPMRIPPHLAACIDWSDPRCPVRRQLVPDRRELEPGGAADPLDEERFCLAPGVVRRFEDRLLAIVTHACPVHCRHCNRKRLWRRGGEHGLEVAGPEQIALALRRAPGAREVILSGGEPLLLSDRALGERLEAARAAPGVELVRIHSRAPVSVPERITPALARRLGRERPLWFVTHFNAAREVTPRAARAVARLLQAGVPVLNQAVLLRGVNDSFAALEALGRALVRVGVKPHTLFQLDHAEGVLHFQVPLRRAVELVGALRRRASGLLVPHLLVDLPGRGGKVAVGPDTIRRWTRRGAWLRGADGRERFYFDGGAGGSAGAAW